MEIKDAILEIDRYGTKVLLKSRGDWLIATVAPVEKKLKTFLKNSTPGTEIIWDFSEAGQFDSAGMMLVIEFETRLAKKNCPVRKKGF